MLDRTARYGIRAAQKALLLQMEPPKLEISHAKNISQYDTQQLSHQEGKDDNRFFLTEEDIKKVWPESLHEACGNETMIGCVLHYAIDKEWHAYFYIADQSCPNPKVRITAYCLPFANAVFDSNNILQLPKKVICPHDLTKNCESRSYKVFTKTQSKPAEKWAHGWLFNGWHKPFWDKAVAALPDCHRAMK